jgi:hypothetical protein
MPVAKIHVHEGGFKDSELAAIGTAVQAALEEVLSVPPEDYFRTVRPHARLRRLHIQRALRPPRA